MEIVINVEWGVIDALMPLTVKNVYKDTILVMMNVNLVHMAAVSVQMGVYALIQLSQSKKAGILIILLRSVNAVVDIIKANMECALCVAQDAIIVIKMLYAIDAKINIIWLECSVIDAYTLVKNVYLKINAWHIMQIYNMKIMALEQQSS